MTDVSVELVKELGLQPAYMYGALKEIESESKLDAQGMFPASVSYIEDMFGFNEYFQRKSLRILTKAGMVEVVVKGKGSHATRYFRLGKPKGKPKKDTKKIVVEPAVGDILKTLTPVETAAYHSCRGAKRKSLLLAEFQERKLQSGRIEVPLNSSTETLDHAVLYIPKEEVIISNNTSKGENKEIEVFNQIASDYIADDYSGNYDKKREQNIRIRCGLYIRKMLEAAGDDVGIVVSSVRRLSKGFAYGKQVDFWLNDNIGVLMKDCRAAVDAREWEETAFKRIRHVA